MEENLCRLSIVCLYLYCRWRSNYQKEGLGSQNQFKPPTFVCPLWPGFQTLYAMVFFCVWLFEMRGGRWFCSYTKIYIYIFLLCSYNCMSIRILALVGLRSLYISVPVSTQELNRIFGVMVSMLALSAVDRWFESRLGQTKDYKNGICCFSAKHAALRRKSKDWLAQKQDNVSEWGGMSICGLLLQWASTIKIQISVLV